jgi:hypothetical protein
MMRLAIPGGGIVPATLGGALLERAIKCVERQRSVAGTAMRPFIVIFSVVTSACAGKTVTVTNQDVQIGPAPVDITPPGGLRIDGRRNEATLVLAKGYHLFATPGPNSKIVLQTPDGTVLLIAVNVLLAGGGEQPMGDNGFRLGNGRDNGQAVVKMINHPTAGPNAVGLRVSANVPVTIKRVEWWSGDPAKRIDWP